MLKFFKPLPKDCGEAPTEPEVTAETQKLEPKEALPPPKQKLAPKEKLTPKEKPMQKKTAQSKENRLPEASAAVAATAKKPARPSREAASAAKAECKHSCCAPLALDPTTSLRCPRSREDLVKILEETF